MGASRAGRHSLPVSGTRPTISYYRTKGIRGGEKTLPHRGAARVSWSRLSRTAQPVPTAPPPSRPFFSGASAAVDSITVAAATDTGRVRASNQDAFGYSMAAQLFVLCDGMGGAAGGEIASRVTIETVLDHLVSAVPLAVSSGKVITRNLEDAVAAANRILVSRAEHEPALSGMGTTLVALLVRGPSAWIAHVGDSRCYLLRGGVLTRCTEDHSLVGEQVRLGVLRPEDAELSPLRNVITRAVGVGEGLRAEVRELAIEPGDTFLLCSDGLTRELREDSIARLLGSAANLETACHALVDGANANGGHDNITCVLVRVA